MALALLLLEEQALRRLCRMAGHQRLLRLPGRVRSLWLQGLLLLV